MALVKLQSNLVKPGQTCQNPPILETRSQIDEF